MVGFAASGLRQPLWRGPGWRRPHTCIVQRLASRRPLCEKKKALLFLGCSPLAGPRVQSAEASAISARALLLAWVPLPGGPTEARVPAHLEFLVASVRVYGGHASLWLPLKCPRLHLPNAQPLGSSAFSFSSFLKEPTEWRPAFLNKGLT